MRRLVLFLILWGTFACGTQTVLAQKRLQASDRVAPRWMHRPPVSRSGALCYVPVTVFTEGPEAANAAALHALTRYLPRNWNVTSAENLEKESYTQRSGPDNRISANSRSQVYRMQATASGEPVELRCKMVDAYWKQVSIGGNVRYSNTILYQVAAPFAADPFEENLLTTRYGARGLWRSAIVPGWGQFHKGANLKGGLILGGCAALAAGIVFTENQRADYVRKIGQTHDLKLIRSYKTKRDHYATARNICIGAAAALYVYNLIDAVAAPGARRVVVRRRNLPPQHYSFAPALLQEGAVGMSASIQF